MGRSLSNGLLAAAIATIMTRHGHGSPLDAPSATVFSPVAPAPTSKKRHAGDGSHAAIRQQHAQAAKGKGRR